MTYTYTERMAFELGLQSAKTAVALCTELTDAQKEIVKDAIESRATFTCPEMRVMEPARKNPNTNPN